MSSQFLLYGSNGFVGDAIARLAVQRGLKPILAGRNPVKVEAQASELNLEYRIFDLKDAIALDKALSEVQVVLHCAGPYINTYKAMLEGCFRTGTHYLDLTGEISVFEALAACDAQAQSHQVMLLPGAGFDVAATDCLALHLKQRLPSATHLTLAFHSRGPASLPPGTAATMLETKAMGVKARVRQNGQLVPFPTQTKTRLIDFGHGPVQATLFPWADVFTAFYSTGIPNIEDYSVLSPKRQRQLASLNYITPLLKLTAVRRFFLRNIKVGSTAEEQAASSVSVWGEVEDQENRTAVSLLHGPEGGLVWTSLVVLAIVQKVLSGQAPPGFQTPARAYGADLVLECEGVTRQDVC
jgi:short subunit dehydrogenase-like uncharacterized protein